MKKIVFSIFAFSLVVNASTFSDLRLELLSQIKTLQEEKGNLQIKLKKEKDKSKIEFIKKQIKDIETKIKSLKKELEIYEDNLPVSS